MSNMLDATQRGRPAMAYIHALEGKLRACRANHRRFKFWSFAAGFAAGVVALLVFLFFFTR